MTYNTLSTPSLGKSLGKYVVTGRLGRGGMAEVYLAHDPLLDRRVAVKVILPHLTTDAGFVARFHREAKLIASLRHANIVQIFDFDVIDDQPFMVMEYLAGETLKARLAALRARGERMALAESVRLLSALAGALDYAHEQGAIHRDIKPANILFTPQGEPVLTDFGIARMLDQTVQMTMTGNIIGTPAYMSPEQAAGKPVDGRSDLYALGVVAYELMTGRVPFQGDSPTAVLMQHLQEPPPPLRTLNPNLPLAVEQVILQALAKEPAARFASVGAFAQALHAALHGTGSTAAAPDAATIVTSPPTAPPEVHQPAVRPPSARAATADHTPAPTATAPIFVARERELDQLAAFLERTLHGQGQICFVTGEAGTGKTALVTEFVRQAQAARPDLVTAFANCNTQSGVGDAYLPFRELLTRLVGVAETQLTGEATMPEMHNQPANFQTRPAQTLLSHGADLIDVFVPGDALLARLDEQSGEHSAWIDRLAAVVQRKAQAAGGESGLEQRHIFEQYTNVLTALANQQPLLLVIDDLQWVDQASADLFFHLSRRMADRPILLLGAYRPDEVALGRGGEAHPLAKVVAELKRYLGEIEISLFQENEAAGRGFVDALLDAEPNHLTSAFRDALFHHTGGHALFTVELLRTMQERGDVTQDATGSWVAASTLDWNNLPPRVEGVIEERIGRLADELREALTVASIEGEDFTAEVVARVQHLDERGLIRHLSRELDKQHHLVHAQGRQRVGQRHLSSYRFRHNLFQKYLYSTLDEVERAYFHEDVGAVLEELYGDQADTIAVQLAWHFTEADMPEKARHYLGVAGEQARRRYANAEALSYLDRALDLTPETDLAERYDLLLARAKVYDIQGAREDQHRDLGMLETLAERLNDNQRRAEIALMLAKYADEIGDYAESMAKAQAAVELATAAQDEGRQARGYLRWGGALSSLSDYVESKSKLNRALALATAGQLRPVEADSLASLGVVAYYLGDYDDAATNWENALAIYQSLGNRQGEGKMLGNLGLAFREQGKYTAAVQYFDKTLQLIREIGDRLVEGHTLVHLGLLALDQGHYAASRCYYQQSLEICRQINDRGFEATSLLGLSHVHQNEGDFDDAAHNCHEALLIFREIGDRRFEHMALKQVGNIALDLGDYSAAVSHFDRALTCFREIGDRQSEGDTLNQLARLTRNSGDEKASHQYGQNALTIAREIGDPWLESDALTGLGHALVNLGQPEVAAAYYQQAITLWREQGRPDLALESVAGLARIALADGDLAQAQANAEELINQFADEKFTNHDLAEEFLTCYRALRAIQDDRAEGVLKTIYDQIQATAACIADKGLRRSYLENVSVNWEIVREWHASSTDEALM